MVPDLILNFHTRFWYSDKTNRAWYQISTGTEKKIRQDFFVPVTGFTGTYATRWCEPRYLNLLVPDHRPKKNSAYQKAGSPWNIRAIEHLGYRTLVLYSGIWYRTNVMGTI